MDTIQGGGNGNAVDTIGQLVQDSQYFLQGDFVVFRVHDHLFRLPQYHLVANSQFFADLFEVPQPSTTNIEGSSVDHPIRVPSDVSVQEFRDFLKEFFPLSRITINYKFSKSSWISTLKLSTLWCCFSVRNIAIVNIKGTLTPQEYVLLGRQYTISEWVKRGYKEMVLRKGTISDDEAGEIGYATTIRLLRMREGEKYGHVSEVDAGIESTELWSHMKNDPKIEELETEIEKVFKEELEELMATERGYPKAIAK